MPKKLGGVLLLVFVATGGTFIYLKHFHKSKTIAPELAVVKEAPTVADVDSDGDGLADWAESLWHTDPHNPDTDGDGTPDGQEVTLHRDPTKAGPKDTINDPTTAVATSSSANNVYKYEYDSKLGANLTEQVSQNLAANYLSATSKGVYTSDLGNSIASNIASQVGSPEVYRDISAQDLRTFDADTDEIKTYLTNVDNAIAEAPDSPLDEIDIIGRAIKNNDYGSLADLDTYIQNFALVRASLLSMRVPNQFANVHLRATRGYDTVIRALEAIRKAKDDPVLITREVARYEAAVGEISASYQLGTKLAQNYL